MKKLSLTVIPALLLTATVLYASMPVSSFIIEPRDLKSDIYTKNKSVFIISSSDEDFSLPAASNQRVLSSRSSSGGKEFTLATGNYGDTGSPGRDEYLKNTPYLNLESSVIKAAAGRFSRSKDRVREISEFVYSHISGKKEGHNIVTAASVMKNRTGDCKQHSILTVALLRANGIPARAVVGIILSEYFNGKRNVFVYHMWAEAYVNGRWELVDSTRPSDIHHNRYIAFAFHNLKTEAPLDYLTAISAISNVKIRQSE